MPDKFNDVCRLQIEGQHGTVSIIAVGVGRWPGLPHLLRDHWMAAYSQCFRRRPPPFEHSTLISTCSNGSLNWPVVHQAAVEPGASLCSASCWCLSCRKAGAGKPTAGAARTFLETESTSKRQIQCVARCLIPERTLALPRAYCWRWSTGMDLVTARKVPLEVVQCV